MTNAQKCIEVVECKIIPLTSNEGTCSSTVFTAADNISTALKSDSRIAEEVINTPSTSGQDKCLMAIPGCVSDASIVPQAETALFDTVLGNIISHQSAEELFDNPDSDPNYMPEETSTSGQDKCLMAIPGCVSDASIVPQAETALFDTVLGNIISHQPAEELFDNPDSDPNYMPEETSTSGQDKCLMAIPSCVSDASIVPQAETALFDTVLGNIISHQSAEELFDNPDSDPNYMPEETTKETSDSDSSDVPDEARSQRQEEVQFHGKRKMTPKEKKGRKRMRNQSKWIDVKAKKELNLGLEHKNRKGKLIPAKQMKQSCKETCRNKCRENISEEHRKELFREFWKIGDHTRQWDYIARCVKTEVKTVDKKQVKKNRWGIKAKLL